VKFDSKEKRLIQLIKQIELSPSHYFDHLNRVAEYAVQLTKLYGGDRKIVVAAALLHDLGRSDPKNRGKRSAEEGARLARPLLKKAGYSVKEIKFISRCIAEHDQPKFKSDLLESRVLKDADFLDGFGARGVMRSIMYTVETDGDLRELKKRLREKMRARLKGLDFEASRRLGWGLHRLAEAFLAELGELPDLTSVAYGGEFVVVEGISGSGKDTQVNMLADYLKRKGKEVKVVNHPTNTLKRVWRQWRQVTDDRLSEFFLILADRVQVIRKEILPALKRRQVVISSRCLVSTQVYQWIKGYSETFCRYCLALEPVADLLVYLDIEVDEALKRVDERVVGGTEKDRGFFGQKQVEQARRFKQILAAYPNVVKVNAAGSKEEIHERVKACVKKKLSLR
jgi:dTMP kinase